MIADCGEIPEDGDDGISNFFKDGDQYPDWPADLDEKPSEISWWIDAVESIKAFGNEHYKVMCKFVVMTSGSKESVLRCPPLPRFGCVG